MKSPWTRRIPCGVVIAVAAILLALSGSSFAQVASVGNEPLWKYRQAREVWSVAYQPGGSQVAVGGTDGLYLLDAASGDVRRTLMGQQAPIRSVAFSADGKLMASASEDKTVCLWNATSGDLVRTLEGHTDKVRSVAFSSDSSTLASAGSDQTVRLWDLKTGAPKGVLSGHTGLIRVLAFSPDGSVLASAGAGTGGLGEVILWDRAASKPRFVLKGFRDDVTCLAFAPDGKSLAAGSYDSTLRIWNLAADGAPTPARTRFEGSPVTALAYSSNSRMLAVGTYLTEGIRFVGGELRLRSAQTLDLAGSFRGPEGSVLAIAFAGDGKTVAVGCGYPDPDQPRPGQVVAWSIRDAQDAIARSDGAPKLAVQVGHRASVDAIAFSSDGQLVASASADNTIKVWNRRTGEVERTFPDLSGSGCLAFSPRSRVLACGRYDGRVQFWDLQTGDLQTSQFVAKGQVTGIAFSPTSPTYAVSGMDGVISILDEANGTVIRKLAGHLGAVNCVAYDSNGQTLCSSGADGTVRLWDVASGAERKRLAGHAGGAFAAVFSPDGRLLVSGGVDQVVRVWDAATGEQVRTLEGHRHRVVAVAYSPDGRMIASASGGLLPMPVKGEVRVWNAETGALIRTYPERDRLARAVQFSPEGNTLAGGVDGLYSGAIHLWDTQAGTLQRTLGGESDQVVAVALSPDGRSLVSGSGDLAHGALRLWDKDTGAWIANLSGHTGQVRHLAYSRDGSRLVSGSSDGTIRLWDSIKRTEIRSITTRFLFLSSLSLSTDGKWIAASSDLLSGTDPGEVRIWEADTGKQVRSFRAHPGGIKGVSFTPDGKHIATVGDDRLLQIRDAQTGELLRSIQERAGSLKCVAYSPDGSLLAAGKVNTATGFGEVNLWDPSSGMLRKSIGGTLFPQCITFSPNGKSLVIPALDQGSGRVEYVLRILDTDTGSRLADLRGHEGLIQSLTFSGDGRRLVSGGWDNTVRVWDPKAGRLLATLVSLPPVENGRAIAGARDAAPPDEYLSVTPDGYYSGSAAVDRYIRFQHGGTLFPAECFQTRYYRPDLVKASLAGETIPPVGAFKGGSPPVAGFTTPTPGKQVEGAQIPVILNTTDDSEVQRLVFFVNGARVDAKPILVEARPILVDARPLPVGTAPPPSQHTKRQTWSLSLPVPASATEIRLQAVAYDDDGLQSPKAEVLFTRGGAVAAKGRLLGLCVGVSKYAEARLNLRFADADADALAKVLNRQRGGYASASVSALTNAAATQTGVKDALDALISRATREDTVVLFLSGHGWRSSTGDFYFASHEVNPTDPAGTGLAWKDVIQRLSRLSEKSGRVIVLLDACHSGSAATNEDLVRAVLTANSGVMLFASSKGSEVSLEREDLGHGLFTTALLEAIRGKAAPAGEKKVTVLDFLQYVTRRVKQLSGDTQHPHIPLLQDFDPEVPITEAE